MNFSKWRSPARFQVQCLSFRHSHFPVHYFLKDAFNRRFHIWACIANLLLPLSIPMPNIRVAAQ
jgi:hypothetical protein